MSRFHSSASGSMRRSSAMALIFAVLGPAMTAYSRALDEAPRAAAGMASVKLEARPPWTGSRVVGTPDPPPPYTVERAFPHLKFENPLVISRAPGTKRLFVGDLKGRLFSFPEDSGCRKADLVAEFVKIHPDVTAFYGLTFHPRYAENRFVYVCYVRKNEVPDGSVVSRFEMRRTDPPTLDPGSETVLLNFFSGGHNGGCLDFGNDGYLYISTGDAGPASPPDPIRTGQDCTDLLSSVLRIDVDHHDPGKNYRIPADNPFVKTPEVRPEIWAFGFRNPWKMSFDHTTGQLWVGDVGWELWEMIDRVKKGENYGWSVTEGPQPVHVNGRRGPAPIVPPIMVHPHSEAASITGGYVYRGSRLPELRGTYVYGDFQTGIVWGIPADSNPPVTSRELARTPLHLVAFGQSNDGELYLLDYDGSQQLYRLVPNPAAGKSTAFPRRLSETGLFASTRDYTPAAGLVPYSVNSELWADGAKAERFMAVPGSGKIQKDEQGTWKFPEGSVLVRTALLGGGKELPARRIETQILHLEAGAWLPYTYVWNPEQTDALLADAKGANLTLHLPGSNADKAMGDRSYRVFARNECILCHNPWVEKKTTVYGPQSASPLGVNSAQLNREQDYNGGTANQLWAFHQMGLLGWTPSPDKEPKQANPYDEGADLRSRARSYLQTNCSHCHQFNAGGSATIALGIDVPDDKMQVLDVKPIQGTFNITDARIIAPGEPERSVLYYRISKLGAGRMPRAGSGEVDVRATRLIHDWIARLKPSPATARKENPGAVELAEDRKALASLAGPRLLAADSRAAAIRRLTSSTSAALLLLDLVDQTQDAHESRPFRSEVVSIARNSPQVEVRDLFERFIPVSERMKRLGDTVDRVSLLRIKGDRESGRAVFLNNPAAQCKTCHRIGSLGQDVGPELSKIGAKYDRSALLEHILDPSKTIEPQYVAYLVETKDGHVLTGVMAEKSDRAIVLRDAQGKSVRLPREQIEHLAPQGRSLMPELLLRDLSPQQAADLLEYLTSLR